MALSHLKPGESVSVAPFGPHVIHKTTALFKSRDLEVIRLVLRAGQSLPPHAVDGDISIQCIEGRLEIALSTGGVVLEPDQLIYLSGRERHAVFAPVSSSALVTIALHNAPSV